MGRFFVAMMFVLPLSNVWAAEQTSPDLDERQACALSLEAFNEAKHAAAKGEPRGADAVASAEASLAACRAGIEQRKQDRAKEKKVSLSAIRRIPEDERTVEQMDAIAADDAARLQADKESPKAVRYAYSAMLCGQLGVVARATERVRQLQKNVVVGSFEGKPVYAKSEESKRWAVDYVRREILDDAQKKVAAYRTALKERRLSPLSCSAPEIRIVVLCVRGASMPACERSPMPAIVQIIEETHEAERESGAVESD